MRNPCPGRTSAPSIFGFRSDPVYAATELRKPGWNSSVTAAPPTTARCSSTVTFSPAAARYAAHTSPLCPPPMIRASQRAPFTAVSLMAPAPRGRVLQGAFGDEAAHARGEAAQANLTVTQRPRGVAHRGHARLHALDQRLVLQTHAPVDAPVQIARDAHLAARVRMHVGNLAHQG